MGEAKPDYKRIRLRTRDDLKNLLSLIEIHGGFTLEDYIACWENARESLEFFYIRRQLDIHTLHLAVCGSEKKYVDSGKISDSQILNSEGSEAPHKMNKEEEKQFFSKKYMAKDFSVEDGCIVLENWKLKSVRIKAILPSVLMRINHKFTIAKESGKMNEFHFVPYTDLSYLLEAADKSEKEIAWNTVEDRCYEYVKKLTLSPSYFQEKVNNIDDITDYHMKRADSLFKVMKEFKLIDEKVAIFREKISSCCIDIPLSDIKIYDGYIEVITDNISLSKSIPWSKLFSYRNCYCVFGYEYLYDKRKDIEQFFLKTLQDGIRKKERKKSIRITTYLTKKGFLESLSFRFPILKEIDADNGDMVTQDVWLSVPFDFLNKEENDGVSLLVNFYNIEELLSSDRYDIPYHIKMEYNKLIDRLHDDSLIESDIHLMSNVKDYTIREVPLYYFGRHIHKDILSANSQYHSTRYKIFRFQENYSHKSDIGFSINCYEYYKTTEESISFVVIDYTFNIIWLCPTNSKYSDYQFAFHSIFCSIETAALALIKYYSSGKDNKRESRGTPEILKKFGLIKSSTKYRW